MTYDDDDLPPAAEPDSFSTELGRTFGGVAFIAIFFAVAALIWQIIK